MMDSSNGSDPVAPSPGRDRRGGRRLLPSPRRLRRAQSPRLMLVCVAAVAVVLPFVISSPFWMRVLALALVYVVLASGLNLLVGFTGLLDLGYIAFFSIGAYETSIITVRLAIDHWGATASQLWWRFFVNLGLAGLIAALAGMILGYPTLRAKSDYLAIMTLAFGQVIQLLAINVTPLTNGALGITGIPPVRIVNVALLQPWQLYYVALVLGTLSVIAIVRVVRSGIGRAWVAIREDEVVAESLGIDTLRFKLMAYATGAFFAGAIGVFYAQMQQYIDPDSFALQNNLLVVSMIIIGGAGTFWGPALGAVLWICFQQWAQQQDLLQVHPELLIIVISALVLLMLVLRPQGLVRKRPTLVLDTGTPPTSSGTSEPPVAPELPPAPRLRPPAHDDDGVHANGVPLLNVVNLTCAFGGVTAVDAVDLHVRAGEVVGIIGPNGAGKTTLFNLVSGLQKPTAGAVEIAGTAVAGSRACTINALGVARTFQNVRLLKEMTVLENLLVGAHRRLSHSPVSVVFRRGRLREAERATSIEAGELLAYLGISELRDRLAGTLSYGDQRRVEIARALMTRPHLLLLDEPAAGMNHTETAALGTVVRRIVADGVSVVIVEHDVELISQICDRVIVLDNGQKIADDRPDAVRADERVVAAYLGTEA